MNVRTGEPKILPWVPGVSPEALLWGLVPPMGHRIRTTNTDYTAAEAPETGFALPSAVEGRHFHRIRRDLSSFRYLSARVRSTVTSPGVASRLESVDRRTGAIPKCKKDRIPRRTSNPQCEESARHCHAAGKTRFKQQRSWLPVVDAFRTFTACPTPAIRSVFSQIQQLAGI